MSKTLKGKISKIERSIRQCQSNGFCIKKLASARSYYLSKLKGSD